MCSSRCSPFLPWPRQAVGAQETHTMHRAQCIEPGPAPPLTPASTCWARKAQPLVPCPLAAPPAVRSTSQTCVGGKGPPPAGRPCGPFSQVRQALAPQPCPGRPVSPDSMLAPGWVGWGHCTLCRLLPPPTPASGSHRPRGARWAGRGAGARRLYMILFCTFGLRSGLV